MIRKHVVFISLPMSGIPDDVVREHIEEAKATYLRETGRTIENTAFVDTMDNPDPPEWLPAERYGVWYLGHSLTKLASVDECYFYPGWRKARGCIVELETCGHYGIPIRYMGE